MSNPNAAKLTAQAQAQLAQKLNVASNTIKVVSVEPVEWPDGSLGCPKPGLSYIQVITPGYKIVLEAKGKTYEYHTSNNRVVDCTA